MDPVETAVEEAWDAFGDRSSLMGDLPLDAVLSRARAGERRLALPRLLELLVADDRIGDPGGAEELAEIVAEVRTELGAAGTTADDRRIITDIVDVWWSRTLMFDPPLVPEASDVLAALARLDEPLIRWLGPWLGDLDGPAARHLVRLIRSGLRSSSWSDQPDAAGQVSAWTRSEPVVFGLALVGGTHLDDGELSSVLDLLVGTDDAI